MQTFQRLFETDFTYLRAFLRNVARYHQRIAVTCTSRQRSWTYAELNREGNRLARALLQDGVGPHDVVMGVLYNTAEFAFCWIGVQKAGGIFSPINFRLAEGEIALHIDDSAPKVLVYDSDVADVVHRAVKRANRPPARLVMVGPGQASAGATLYATYTQDMSDEEIDTGEKGPYDEIVRLYTSGTTGEPKGVPLTNVNNLIRSYDVLMHFPLGPDDKTMNMTPWFHAGGLHSGGPCPVLHAGAEMVALKSFNPKTVLDAVESHRLTFLIGAPANLEMLALVQAKEPRDLKSLKGIVTMGAPLSREACLRYHGLLTPRIFNGYGTTETFWNTFLRPHDLPGKAGSAGRACTDDLVRVVRIAEGRDHTEPEEMVPTDGTTEGEVVVQSLKAPYRYHNRPDEERRNYYKGWYYTKDIATWDDGGYLAICGRRDDMIISEGEKIHPAQIEAVISEHPKVADAAVVGAPDPVKGEIVTAYVVRKDPSLTTQEIFRFLTQHPGLAKFKRPRYFKFVEEIPLTATGKKRRFVVKQWAQEDLRKGELKR